MWQEWTPLRCTYLFLFPMENLLQTWSLKCRWLKISEVLCAWFCSFRYHFWSWTNWCSIYELGLLLSQKNFNSWLKCFQPQDKIHYLWAFVWKYSRKHGMWKGEIINKTTSGLVSSLMLCLWIESCMILWFKGIMSLKDKSVIYWGSRWTTRVLQ